MQINLGKCITATTKNALSVESRSHSTRICRDNLTMIALSRAASIEYRDTSGQDKIANRSLMQKSTFRA